MLTKNIITHSSHQEALTEITTRVTQMLADSKLQIRFEEYRDHIKLEGQRIMTGKNTIIITCDGGDPDVDVMIDTHCCGR